MHHSGWRLVLCSACLVAWRALPAVGEATFEGADPLRWARPPHARVSHAITMAAEKLSAPGGVAYCFRCTSGGVSDSGWQAEPEYLATGLQPETEYTFVAEARDGASGEMLRATSEPVSITTRKADEFDAIMADEIELIPVMVGGPKD
ncbi:MAG TPA: hypothetical protein QGH10_20410, partial [Armatimonadota bacterium]|nr:hypothetical protein [Armatimonadota bacterium]